LARAIIIQDNDFEIFIDPDASTHFYKELEINARAVTWNLLLSRPYINGGPAVCNATRPGQCSADDPEHHVTPWDITPELRVGVDVNGSLNDPAGSHSWSVEACLPLGAYAKYENDTAIPPKPGSFWRINFSRVQWRVQVHQEPDGRQMYWKDDASPADNW
jgi:hypothetical protein